MAKKQSELLTSDGSSKFLSIPDNQSNVYVWGTFGGASITFEVKWNNLLTQATELFTLKDCDEAVYTVTEEVGPIELRVSSGTAMSATVSGATGSTALYWGVR